MDSNNEQLIMSLLLAAKLQHQFNQPKVQHNSVMSMSAPVGKPMPPVSQLPSVLQYLSALFSGQQPVNRASVVADHPPPGSLKARSLALIHTHLLSTTCQNLVQKRGGSGDITTTNSLEQFMINNVNRTKAPECPSKVNSFMISELLAEKKGEADETTAREGEVVVEGGSKMERSDNVVNEALFETDENGWIRSEDSPTKDSPATPAALDALTAMTQHLAASQKQPGVVQRMHPETSVPTYNSMFSPVTSFFGGGNNSSNSHHQHSKDSLENSTMTTMTTTGNINFLKKIDTTFIDRFLADVGSAALPSESNEFSGENWHQSFCGGNSRKRRMTRTDEDDHDNGREEHILYNSMQQQQQRHNRLKRMKMTNDHLRSSKKGQYVHNVAKPKNWLINEELSEYTAPTMLSGDKGMMTDTNRESNDDEEVCDTGSSINLLIGEAGGMPMRKRKSRTAFNKGQVAALEKRFIRQKYLTPIDRDELADTLKLTAAQVITWFQNRRAKLKRDLEEQQNDIRAAVSSGHISCSSSTGSKQTTPNHNASKYSNPAASSTDNSFNS